MCTWCTVGLGWLKRQAKKFESPRIRVIREFELFKDNTIIENSRDQEKIRGIVDFELKEFRVNQVQLYYNLCYYNISGSRY